MQPLRSARNPQVADAIRLRRARRRAESGNTLLEGPHLLEEAIHAAAELKTVFVCEGFVVTFQETPGTFFELVRGRLREGRPQAVGTPILLVLLFKVR